MSTISRPLGPDSLLTELNATCPAAAALPGSLMRRRLGQALPANAPETLPLPSHMMKTPTFLIDDFEVGGDRTFVIAEIGNNHNGSLELAKRLIDASIEAGADAVKFQLRDRTALYRARDDGAAEDLGVEYLQDLLSKIELDVDAHRRLRDYCREKNIRYMCTPWDEPSVDVLATFDVPALKIASADLSNPYLIRKAASVGRPLIVSTGMSYEHEIVDTVSLLNELGVPFALLHCNSAYPAPDDDIQLGYLKRLSLFHGIVGYSGHERGTAITIAAVALGARVVERHITLDRNMEGPDHLASLEPVDFRWMVDSIRRVERAVRWDGGERRVSQGELLNRENLGQKRRGQSTHSRRRDIRSVMPESRKPRAGTAAISPERIDR